MIETLCMFVFEQQQQQMLSAGRAQLVRGSLHPDLTVSAPTQGLASRL